MTPLEAIPPAIPPTMRLAPWFSRAGCALLAGSFCLALAQQGAVDANALKRAAPGEWLSYGRDYAETHHSPLKQIDASNVSRLGLAWSYAPEGPAGNIEATPIIANG